MGKFKLLQAAYCVAGILFFVQDLLAKQPLGNAVVNAFIWPYAQWPVIHDYALRITAPVMKLIS